MPARTALQEAVAALADVIARPGRASAGAQPEDQLKGPVQVILTTAGQAWKMEVESYTEVRVEGVGARPDIGVRVNGLLCGYVELKAPGRGARPERLKAGNVKQWSKFKALPNLLYTDGIDWALYRSGERQSKVLRLGDDVEHAGAAAIEPEVVSDLERLLRDFLLWEPIVPSSPRALAEQLAPLCHFLREEVQVALRHEGSAIAHLAAEWRQALFPTADDNQFADAYAQTITYALLLARFEGDREVRPETAETTIRRGHALLAQSLRILTDPQAQQELKLGIDLLQRLIRAIDISALQKKTTDPWLYFYEDFLAKYDPKLRNDRGVYYTPWQVIRAQCRLVAELLETRFGKRLGLASEGVVVLDPGAGTGAYLLAVLQAGLDAVAERQGPGAQAGRATEMARNLYGFEILVGPYAVAHLRLTQAILAAGGELPADGAHVYLTDTLESPHAETLSTLSFLHKPLADEHRRAQEVKSTVPVLVCIGNPPYNRQQIDPDDETTGRKGGWVRHGETEDGSDAIFQDFLRPGRSAGAGVHLKNLYNDYVYFWRWALWKVFEEKRNGKGEVVQPALPGIVSFISASSYLKGPGFVGMRQMMRQTFDELWILDLEGDNKGPRKTENVFAIQSPVAIAVGVRYGEPRPDVPAQVHYARLTGTRAEKLATLAHLDGLPSLDWRDCFEGWMQPFLPRGEGDYFSWPLLTDLFPWQQPGVKAGRTWCIAPSRQVLVDRWKTLASAKASEKGTLFKDSPTGRKARMTAPRSLPRAAEAVSIADLKAESKIPASVRFGYRSFDRQWIIADGRVLDRPGPPLWRAHSDRQLYLVSLLTGVLGRGPAATASALVPDLHFFRGSFGGRDVIPLYRDSAAKEANVTRSLLRTLSTRFGQQISEEDLFAYLYALFASPAYVQRFYVELTVPGPRLPLTKSGELFRQSVDLGRWLLFLHTFGERFAKPGEAGVPTGRARATKPIPSQPGAYPEDFSYDTKNKVLQVGQGEFAPVDPAVYGFSVSGLQVVRSWLDYRVKLNGGRRSSPLDEIRPERWTAQMTEELLELLWVLEHTLALLPGMKANLEAILAGELFAAAELPIPSPAERKAPGELSGVDDAQGVIDGARR